MATTSLSMAGDLVRYIVEWCELAIKRSIAPDTQVRVERLFTDNSIVVVFHRAKAHRQINYTIPAKALWQFLEDDERVRLLKWAYAFHLMFQEIIDDLAGPYSAPAREQAYAEMGLSPEDRRKAVETDRILTAPTPLLTQGQRFRDLLMPGLRQIVGTYESTPQQWDAIFNGDKS